MGAAIAYVSGRAGFDVALKDVSIEAAQKGKGYSGKLEAKALERGTADVIGTIAGQGDRHAGVDPPVVPGRC